MSDHFSMQDMGRLTNFGQFGLDNMAGNANNGGANDSTYHGMTLQHVPGGPNAIGLQGQNFGHHNVAQQNMAQQNMAQQNMAQQNMAQQNMAQQNMAQQNMVQQQNFGHQKVAQQNVTEQNMPQQQMAQQQNMPQQHVAQQNMAQQQYYPAQQSQQGNFAPTANPGAAVQNQNQNMNQGMNQDQNMGMNNNMNNNMNMNMNQQATPGSYNTAQLNFNAQQQQAPTNGFSATPMYNGNTTSMYNGNAASMYGGNTAPMVNGNTTAMANGHATPMVTQAATPMVNSTAAPMSDGNATPVVSGPATPMTSAAATPMMNGNITSAFHLNAPYNHPPHQQHSTAPQNAHGRNTLAPNNRGSIDLTTNSGAGAQFQQPQMPIATPKGSGEGLEIMSTMGNQGQSNTKHRGQASISNGQFMPQQQQQMGNQNEATSSIAPQQQMNGHPNHGYNPQMSMNQAPQISQNEQVSQQPTLNAQQNGAQPMTYQPTHQVQQNQPFNQQQAQQQAQQLVYQPAQQAPQSQQQVQQVQQNRQAPQQQVSQNQPAHQGGPQAMFYHPTQEQTQQRAQQNQQLAQIQKQVLEKKTPPKKAPAKKRQPAQKKQQNLPAPNQQHVAQPMAEQQVQGQQAYYPQPADGSKQLIAPANQPQQVPGVSAAPAVEQPAAAMPQQGDDANNPITIYEGITRKFGSPLSRKTQTLTSLPVTASSLSMQQYMSVIDGVMQAGNNPATQARKPTKKATGVVSSKKRGKKAAQANEPSEAPVNQEFRTSSQQMLLMRQVDAAETEAAKKHAEEIAEEKYGDYYTPGSHQGPGAVRNLAELINEIVRVAYIRGGQSAYKQICFTTTDAYRKTGLYCGVPFQLPDDVTPGDAIKDCRHGMDVSSYIKDSSSEAVDFISEKLLTYYPHLLPNGFQLPTGTAPVTPPNSSPENAQTQPSTGNTQEGNFNFIRQQPGVQPQIHAQPQMQVQPQIQAQSQMLAQPQAQHQAEAQPTVAATPARRPGGKKRKTNSQSSQGSDSGLTKKARNYTSTESATTRAQPAKSQTMIQPRSYYQSQVPQTNPQAPQPKMAYAPQVEMPQTNTVQAQHPTPAPVAAFTFTQPQFTEPSQVMMAQSLVQPQPGSQVSQVEKAQFPTVQSQTPSQVEKPQTPVAQFQFPQSQVEMAQSPAQTAPQVSQVEKAQITTFQPQGTETPEIEMTQSTPQPQMAQDMAQAPQVEMAKPVTGELTTMANIDAEVKFPDPSMPISFDFEHLINTDPMLVEGRHNDSATESQPIVSRNAEDEAQSIEERLLMVHDQMATEIEQASMEDDADILGKPQSPSFTGMRDMNIFLGTNDDFMAPGFDDPYAITFDQPSSFDDAMEAMTWTP
ncbi:hypothetical protein FDECE_11926 [Fusarium decemcellulare]|nr:hypothetical protein FDECE_11926 [Fusarium decemcellulare]